MEGDVEVPAQHQLRDIQALAKVRLVAVQVGAHRSLPADHQADRNSPSLVGVFEDDRLAALDHGGYGLSEVGGKARAAVFRVHPPAPPLLAVQCQQRRDRAGRIVRVDGPSRYPGFLDLAVLVTPSAGRSRR